MTHPIITDLQWRYTTKKYDASKRIPADDLAVLYEALRLSASSINAQPWKFIVIESEQAKARLARTFANKFQFNQQHIKAASHTILFAHNPQYNREDYAQVIDADVKNGRIPEEKRDQAFGAFAFVDLNTDETGNNANWTKSQTYIALGNAMHTLARLSIDSTPMEGIDEQLIAEEFKHELAGYRCEVALVIGYHDQEEDYNAKLPKSRLAKEAIISVL